MPNRPKGSSGSKGSAFRAFEWFEARTGTWSILKKALDERIPGGARVAYVFGSGLLFILILQGITGVSLALYYTPTAETAHTSVEYITKQVAGGAFLRSLHSYGASAMIIVLGLHFLQTFFYGSFKGRRELLWMSGAMLSFFVLGMGFTGYLLPWDQKAYFATAVGTNIVGQVPFVGGILLRLLRGGNTIGTLTLSRFYVAHVFLIPASMFVLVGAHVFLFRKAGPAGPVSEDPVEPKLATGSFYPLQVLLDMAFALAIIAVLCVLAYLRPVTLGPIANPADTHFLPRPEWYYLPMFEWLKFWEGPSVVLGAVVVPGLLATAFFLLPLIDRRLERRPWRRPIPALAVAVVVMGMIYLGARSRIEDERGMIGAQLALQEVEEKAYSAAPFHPLIDSAEGMETLAVSNDPPDPKVAAGRAIFTQRGCVGCHGARGTGTAIAPSLAGVTGKFDRGHLIALFHDPTPRMRAAGMPVVDGAPAEMDALLAYLGAIGTPAANVQASFQTVVPSASDDAGGQQPWLHRASLKPVPDITANPQQKVDLVAAGRQLFQERACFACHGQAGSGGRAPALAPLVARLGDPELRELLHNPNQQMRAGGMPAVDITPDELTGLISYLRSLPMPKQADHHAQEIAGYHSARTPTDPPAAPDPAPAVSPGARAETPPHTQQSSLDDAGRAIFVSRGCIACHGLNANGTRLAPSLIGVADRFPGDELPSLLRHPNAKMREGGMPTPAVNDAELQELVNYLRNLAGSVARPPVAVASTELHLATQPESQSLPPSMVDSERQKLNPLAVKGRLVFQRDGCEGCHGIGGLNGTVAAPGLAGTASLLPEPMLRNLLLHYSARMRSGGMPPSNFTSKELQSLIAYIRSLSLSAREESHLESGPMTDKK